MDWRKYLKQETEKRIIKFRAYDKELKCMQPVIEIGFEFEEVIFDRKLSYDGENDIISWQPFSKVILLQSTGLLDKNKVEMFEGDIVKIDGKEITIIEWKEGGLTNKYNGRWHTYIIHGKDAEIIGNIYEDEELIPKKC